MTHPFHPLVGRELVCVGERYNRYGKRLLLQSEAGQICSVPPHWTDLVEPDPELALGGGDALLRLADLLELADMVERLREKHMPPARKPNHAANVRQKTPQRSRGIKEDPCNSSTKPVVCRKPKLDKPRRKRRK